MAIDATVVGVQQLEDKRLCLVLDDRRDKHGKAVGIDGQTRLFPKNEGVLLDDLEAFIGRDVWGNSSELYVGDKTIAKREMYTGIHLVSDWREILTQPSK